MNSIFEPIEQETFGPCRLNCGLWVADNAEHFGEKKQQSRHKRRGFLFVLVDPAVEIHRAKMAAVFLIFQGEPKRHYAVHELIIRLARQGREARNIHTRHPRHFSPCFGNSLDRMPISTASATSRAALGWPPPS